MQKYNLLKETLLAVRATGIPLTRLAPAAGVSERWLYKITESKKSGSTEVKNPSILEVQKLHDYLLQLRKFAPSKEVKDYMNKKRPAATHKSRK